MMLGKGKRGIFGSGRATDSSFEDEHWEEDRRRKGELATFVNVTWDTLKHEPLISIDRLQRPPFNAMNWSPQGSGAAIAGGIVAALEREWKAARKAETGVGSSTVEFRDDPESARQVLSALFPVEAVKRRCCRLLARAITFAHSQGESSWSVTLFAHKIRLNVGQAEVLVLGPNGVYLVVDKGVLSRVGRQTLDSHARGSRKHYSSVPGTHAVVTLSGQEVTKEYLGVRSGHERFIENAAKAKTLTPHRKSFSPGVLLFLNEELRIELPFPGYALNASAPLLSSDAAASRHYGAGFGDPETNRRVELAAIGAVRKKYRGWRIKSVESDKCGFDLVCRRGEAELHVEVKGVSGTVPGFFMTRRELKCAETDSKFKLAVVTEALTSEPIIREWDGRDIAKEFEKEGTLFELWPRRGKR